MNNKTEDKNLIKHKGYIFISYKDSENKQPTEDKKTVERLSECLKSRGYKVFYAPEYFYDKAGEDWKEDIDKELKLAQLCIVYASKKEYFTAEWVKYEWTTFLNRSKTDKENLRLISVCPNREELPNELKFGHLIEMDKDKLFLEPLLQSIDAFFKSKNQIKFGLKLHEFSEDTLRENCGDLFECLENADTDENCQFSLGCRYFLGEGLDQKDIVKAIELWEKCAKKVSSEVCYYLATCYLLGLKDEVDKSKYVVEVNKEKGLSYLYSASKQGFSAAQNALGECYYFGEWVALDFGKAVEWYAKSAENNYAEAQYNLGVCYEYGKGVEQSFKSAFVWYEKAANQNESRSQYNLGLSYYIGQGVQKDEKMAAYWMIKSAKQGNVYAINDLGIFFQLGIGVSKSEKFAVAHFNVAARAGYTLAQNNLGTCYFNGTGVEQDYNKAFFWWGQAAIKNLPLSQSGLGICYLMGFSVKQNLDKAEYWLKKSAEQGYVIAQYQLGVLYMGSITGIVNTDVKKDYNKAVYWLEKSAKQGFAIAQCSLGLCYLDEEWENADVNKAIEYFNLSAKQGYFLAEYFLAICYYDGIGVEQDYNKAVEYYTKIAKMENFYENSTSMMKSENVFFGSQESAFVTEIILKSVKPMQFYAQYTLGNCYYNGLGVEKNVFTAAYWYLFAANNGSAEAQCELGRLYYLGEGVPQNYSIAVEWFTKSAEQGDDVAQFNLGVCYEYGKGVEQDLEKAVYWYEKSAEQGNEDAVKALKRLNNKK